MIRCCFKVLPVADEWVTRRSGFVLGPRRRCARMAAGGLLHKYAGRALVIATGACGIHCRYCFRREFPYAAAGSRQAEAWQPAAMAHLPEQILRSKKCCSVAAIPLTLVDEETGSSARQRIESIDHVRRRFACTPECPMVIPQRITETLVDRLAGSRLAVWMVIHANHPKELRRACVCETGRLIDSGIPVLNQAVLLRGVNDRANVD